MSKKNNRAIYKSFTYLRNLHKVYVHYMSWHIKMITKLK